MPADLVNLSSLPPDKKREVWELIKAQDPEFMDDLSTGFLSQLRKEFGHPPVLVPRSYLQKLSQMRAASIVGA